MLKHSLIYLWTVLSLLVASVSMDAQTVLDEYVAKVVSSCVNADYQYVITDGKIPVKGSGHVTMQGSSYFMKGNGLEVYCDSFTKWTVDREAMEVIVENADIRDISTNPLLLLNGYKSLFRYVSTENLTFNSKQCVCFTLVPLTATKPKSAPASESELKSGSSASGESAESGDWSKSGQEAAVADMSKVELYFSPAGDTLLGLRVEMKKGTVISVTIPSIKLSAPTDVKSFSFDESCLSKDFVVTDLR